MKEDFESYTSLSRLDRMKARLTELSQIVEIAGGYPVDEVFAQAADDENQEPQRAAPVAVAEKSKRTPAEITLRIRLGENGVTEVQEI